MTLNLPSLLFTENEFCVFIILNISAYWEIAQFIRTWDFFFPQEKRNQSIRFKKYGSKILPHSNSHYSAASFLRIQALTEDSEITAVFSMSAWVLSNFHFDLHFRLLTNLTHSFCSFVDRECFCV